MDNYQLKLLDLKQAIEVNWLMDFINQNYPVKAHPITFDDFYCSKKMYFQIYFNENIIGISGIDQKTPTLAETIRTIVNKEARGQGHGKNISHLIEQKCVQLGIKKVMSTIYSHNVEMISIKLKQGYTIEGYHPHHEAPGFHEYSMGKILSTN